MLSFIQPSLQHLPCSRPVSGGPETKAHRPSLSPKEPRVAEQTPSAVLLVWPKCADAGKRNECFPRAGWAVGWVWKQGLSKDSDLAVPCGMSKQALSRDPKTSVREMCLECHAFRPRLWKCTYHNTLRFRSLSKDAV